MKLRITKQLRIAILATSIGYTLSLMPQAYAGAPVIDDNLIAEEAFMDGMDEDVILNFTGSVDDFFTDSFTTGDNIHVQSWYIRNTESSNTYTFNGTISDYTVNGSQVGSGNIVFNRQYDSDQTYTFNGSMANFSGDIRAEQGGLTLRFGNEEGRDTAALQNISGTGNISMDKGEMSYNVAGQSSTITNEFIEAGKLNFNGGAGTEYTISGNIFASSVGSNGATLNMQLASSLTISDTNASELNINSYEAMLNFNKGASIGHLHIASGHSSLLLTPSTETALSTTLFTMATDATLYIELTFEGVQQAGTTYTLISGLDSSITSTDQFQFNSTLGPNSYSISIVGNELKATVERDSLELQWAGGSGTWTQGGGGWTDADAAFYSTDSVSFINDDVSIANTITIENTVYPSLIKVSGEGDTEFTGSGDIQGAAALVKSGKGTLTISNMNSYSGGTTVKEGKIVIASDSALGTGAITVESGATLSLAHGSAMGTLEGATLHSGSYVAIDSDIEFFKGMASSIGSGVTLQVADGVTATLYANGFYFSLTEGYTVELGKGAHLTNNADMLLVGETTTVKGSTADSMGIYTVRGLEMGADAHAAGTTLDVLAGATFKVTGTRLSTKGTSGGALFMLSGHSDANTINVSGTLDIASGISNGDGSGTINIQDGGEFILRRGLAAVTNSTAEDSITINVESGATLTLFNKDITGYKLVGENARLIAPTVNVKSGATIQAGAAGTTTLSDSLRYETDATVNFSVAEGRTLELDHSVNLGTLNFQNDGNIKLLGETNTISKLSFEDYGQLFIKQMTVGALTVSSTVADGALFTAVGSKGASFSSDIAKDIIVADASIQGVQMGRSATRLSSDASSFSRTTFTDLTLRAANTSSSLKDVTLTRVTITSENGGSFSLLGSMSLTDSSLDLSAVEIHQDARIAYNNVRITGGLTVEKTADISFTTIAGTDATDVQTWTVVGIDKLLSAASTSGSLTLDLGELTGFTALGTGVGESQFAAFILEGVTEEMFKSFYHNDITLVYTTGGMAYSIDALGQTLSGGNVVLYIPEPSSATLSLLALAGLLARRRRKAA